MKRIFILGLLASFILGASAQAYLNPNLSADERANDLISRLTLEEKVSLLTDNSEAVKRLNIPFYGWWNEALHGYARSGEATCFPQTIGMAASWDNILLEQVYTAISDEARAKNTRYRAESTDGGTQRYQGLSCWTPNINIFRDPRWGRGQETYGEDPYLTSQMGIAVVRGLQGPDSCKYDKLQACAKHFAVHSGPEYERHFFNAQDLPARDMQETYLYAFSRLIKETNVREVMCAYNAVNGQPCCGNNPLLQQILRDEWGYQGLIVSDCWAIRDFYTTEYPAHMSDSTKAEAAAHAMLAGTDLNCGNTFPALTTAVHKGYLDEGDIDRALFRVMRDRFRLGLFDPDSLVCWTQIPYSTVCSEEHDQLALKMAEESMVLLQNDGILPLKSGNYNPTNKIAIIGPNINDSISMWGNYYTSPRQTVTIADGILAKLGADAAYCNQLTEWVTPDYYVAEVGNPTFYRAPETRQMEMQLLVSGKGRVLVNGKEICSFDNGHGGRKQIIPFPTEKGKTYTIRVAIDQLGPDHQLNYSIGHREKTTVEQMLQQLEGITDVIYVGGISPLLEGEEMDVDLPGFRGGDRTSIELPQIQRETLRALHQAGKRVIFVNLSGAAIALAPEAENCNAILQAWYGGQNAGKAVANVLFGDYNPGGRLPVTFYTSDNQLPAFGAYEMTGRTYRYMTEKPLFPFGHGLSYTTFKYNKAQIKKVGTEYQMTITLTNNGQMAGDEVVQVYLRRDADTQGPKLALRGFQRVNLAAGEKKLVTISLTENQLKTFNQASEKMELIPGAYTIYYGGTSDITKLNSIKLKIK